MSRGGPSNDMAAELWYAVCRCMDDAFLTASGFRCRVIDAASRTTLLPYWHTIYHEPCDQWYSTQSCGIATLSISTIARAMAQTSWTLHFDIDAYGAEDFEPLADTGDDEDLTLTMYERQFAPCMAQLVAHLCGSLSGCAVEAEENHRDGQYILTTLKKSAFSNWLHRSDVFFDQLLKNGDAF